MAERQTPPRGYRIEALSKGLRVLALFSEQQQALRLTEIVEQTGMLMPTVYRIAMTLESDGFLDRLPDGRYRPGVKVLGLGFSALRGMDLVQLATGPLQNLADVTDETVNLGILSGDKVVYLVRIRNSDLVTANIQVGSQLPAIYSSLGKLLLAHLSADDLAEAVTDESFAVTGGRQPAKSMAELAPELGRIRGEGFAIQNEELAWGLRSIAAPVRNAEGNVVAAANIAVNANDWPMARILKELKPQILRTAATISTLMGAAPESSPSDLDDRTT